MLIGRGPFQMGWRRLFHLPETLIPKSHHPSFSTSSFLVTKLPKKLRKKPPNPDSPRTKPVQPTSTRLPHLESLLDRDAYFRFLTRTKQFLSLHPHRAVPLSDAGKLHQQLGFPRGRSIRRFVSRHPLLFTTRRDGDHDEVWLGFSGLMDRLLDEERSLADSMEADRVTKVRKLLMMSKARRIALNKLHHCRLLFGLPDDFRDRVLKYPDLFRVSVDGDGRRVLELASWDPALAVSEIERLFVHDEERAKRAFRFPVKHARELFLDVEDVRRLNLLSTLPLVSPYGDRGRELDVWSVEAEKFRVGVLHEFLSLTLEKRASIHHIVEFKEEFCLTRHTYDMLKRQPRTFYLAGTEMNWAVFLKDAYDDTGELVDKDPQVVFDEKLRRYAMMKKEGDLEPCAAGRWGDD